eukprot:4831349-Lingulodinium_polyedra.AAC.1
MTTTRPSDRRALAPWPGQRGPRGPPAPTWGRFTTVGLWAGWPGRLQRRPSDRRPHAGLRGQL